jgi:hypothetical protein
MLQLQKNPMAKGVLPGLLQADRVLHTMQKADTGAIPRPLTSALKPVCFSVVSAALSFAFSIIRSVFGTISNNKVKEKERQNV